jgi:hypothetical protein
LQTDQLTTKERHLLMQEWETILHYWANDNSILWLRCSVFILINSMLLSSLVIVPSDNIMPIWVIKYGIPSFAIIMNGMWWPISIRSVAYIRHFQDRADDIRKMIPPLRFMDDQLLKSYFRHWWLKLPGRMFLQIIPGLFFILWIVILSYYAFCG